MGSASTSAAGRLISSTHSSQSKGVSSSSHSACRSCSRLLPLLAGGSDASLDTAAHFAASASPASAWRGPTRVLDERGTSGSFCRGGLHSKPLHSCGGRHGWLPPARRVRRGSICRLLYIPGKPRCVLLSLEACDGTPVMLGEFVAMTCDASVRGPWCQTAGESGSRGEGTVPTTISRLAAACREAATARGPRWRDRGPCERLLISSPCARQGRRACRTRARLTPYPPRGIGRVAVGPARRRARRRA